MPLKERTAHLLREKRLISLQSVGNQVFCSIVRLVSLGGLSRILPLYPILGIPLLPFCVLVFWLGSKRLKLDHRAWSHDLLQSTRAQTLCHYRCASQDETVCDSTLVQTSSGGLCLGQPLNQHNKIHGRRLGNDTEHEHDTVHERTTDVKLHASLLGFWRCIEWSSSYEMHNS